MSWHDELGEDMMIDQMIEQGVTLKLTNTKKQTMINEKIFADGVFFEKRDNQPDWVVGQLSLKVPALIPFLEKHSNKAGYVNINILTSKKGGYYCELNQYSPEPKASQEVEAYKEDSKDRLADAMTAPEYPTDEINPEDIPF